MNRVKYLKEDADCDTGFIEMNHITKARAVSLHRQATESLYACKLDV